MIQFYSFAHYVQAVVVTTLLIILIACIIAQAIQAFNLIKNEAKNETEDLQNE